MRVIFFLKMFKIDSKFRKCKKKEKIFLVSEIIASFKKRKLVISSQWVGSPKILHSTQGDFFNTNCFDRDQ